MSTYITINDDINRQTPHHPIYWLLLLKLTTGIPSPVLVPMLIHRQSLSNAIACQHTSEKFRHTMNARIAAFSSAIGFVGEICFILSLI